MMSDPSQGGGGSPTDSFWGAIEPPPDAISQSGPAPDSSQPGGADVWWGAGATMPQGVQTTSQAVPTNQGPPWIWLGLGLGVPLVVGIVSLIWAPTWVHAIAWAVIYLAGFGFLMAFTAFDLKSRASNAYVARDEIVSPLRVAIIVVTLALSMWNAWLFADWFARLPIFMGMG